MNADDYQRAALRTENTPNFICKHRGAASREALINAGEQRFDDDLRLSRLIHAILGMITELGELCDPLKRHLIYGAPLGPEQRANMGEEIGDKSWYGSLAADALETKLSTILETNIAKLRKRFPDKFTTEKALNRDLEAEKAIIEGQQLPPAKDALEKLFEIAQLLDLNTDAQPSLTVSQLASWITDAIKHERKVSADRAALVNGMRAKLDAFAKSF